MIARIVSVNVSPGGVPKRNVESAMIHEDGVEGDAHTSAGHGGPNAAVCLYGVEAIARVAADGHRAFSGAFGENLTLEGIAMDSLAPGDRLAFEPGGVLVELTQTTSPCKTIAQFFRDGDFSRILPAVHPADARWYARVLREGRVSVGDTVEVRRPNETGGLDRSPQAGE